MAREIKFKIWDSRENRMSPPINLQSILSLNEDAIADAMGGYIFQKDRVLLEFAGLEDKNGDEIYEGDLLKITTEYLKYCGDKTTSDQYRERNFALYEVFYHDNDACDQHIGFQMNRRHSFGADGELQIAANFKPEITKNCVIVGNIYKNPKLLTQNKN